MRSPRLIALSSCCAMVLAACGNQNPASQAPAAPQVSVDTSNLSSLSLKIEPKSPDLTLMYAVNGGAQYVWQGSSDADPRVAGVCPGNNSLTYTVKVKDETVVDNKSTSFVYDPNGAFTVAAVAQPVQLSDGQALNLALPLILRSAFGCSAVVSAKLDGAAVQATVAGTPPTVTVSSAALSSGDHSLAVSIQIGAASQTVTLPVVVGAASGGDSTGGTSSGGTSTGGTSTPPASTVSGVKLQPAQLSLKAGSTGTLTATVAGTGGFDPAVVFSSSDPKVASVDDQGTVTARVTGQVTITATSKQDASQSATATVTVSAATQGSFLMNLSPSSLTIAPGASSTSGLGVVSYGGYKGLLNLTFGDPPAGSGLTLRPDRTTISSDVSGVLTVYVAAGAPNGSYKIPVTANDGTLSSTAQLTVTVASPTTPPPSSDTQKPVIGAVNLSGSTLTSTPASVTVGATDNVAVSTVTLSVDGGGAQRLTGTNGSYTGSLDLSNIQNGTHSYVVTATDSSNNIATVSGSFTVQLSGRGPSILKAISIGSTSPGTGALIEPGGTALIGSGRKVLRINPDAGTYSASGALDGDVVAMMPMGSTLYVATAGNSLYTLDLGSLSGATKVANSLGSPSNFAQSGLGLFLGTSSGVFGVSSSGATKVSSMEATSLVAGGRALYVASRSNSQIVQMSAAGNVQGSPVAVRANWMTMNAAGDALNVAPAGSPWSLSQLDLGSWTLASKMSLKASAINVVQYNNALFAVDNVGFLTSPDGTSQRVENGAGVSYGAALSGNAMYIGTDSGTLYVYTLNGRSASYQNKTAGLGKLGAPLAADARGRIYYPNAVGTLYILQPGN